ncbi:uncharacterized protein LTR77_000988 [Saxophila tyrrhenica]|uniref:Uncharacterized protein n=1 Tax=Saxophila tyrrhenica TaxID=1690608 RepID=A0AAV9PRH5_9PEZI|nr:hypothetical protein LTR77_000988 [Saxophila tyrrhenica]
MGDTASSGFGLHILNLRLDICTLLHRELIPHLDNFPILPRKVIPDTHVSTDQDTEMASTRARGKKAGAKGKGADSEDEDPSVRRPSGVRKRTKPPAGDTEEPARKKRKSAEASTLKLKEIADAEAEYSEEEDFATAKGVGPDISKMKPQELMVQEEVAVAPGFRL